MADKSFERMLQGLVILIVDGNHYMRRVTRTMLMNLGAKSVAEASDGEQAIRQIAAEPPQLILAELNLPSMPAGRLAQWLSQSWRTRQIPVIVLGGDLDPSDTSLSEDVRSSLAGVLMKPFTLRGMLDEVRRVIRTAERRS